MDKVHENACGSYSLVFRLAQPFLSHCPCCSFYRGFGIGLVIAGIVSWAV